MKKVFPIFAKKDRFMEESHGHSFRSEHDLHFTFLYKKRYWLYPKNFSNDYTYSMYMFKFKLNFNYKFMFFLRIYSL